MKSTDGPRLFIIGAMKAGTSALASALASHPSIYVPFTPEPGYYYWRSRPAPTGPGDELSNAGKVCHQRAYESLYANTPPGQLAVDGSTTTYRSPTAIEAVMRDHPSAHVLLVLREPVARIVSAYTHLRRDGRETLSLEEALDAEHDRTVGGWEPLWHYRAASDYREAVECMETVVPPAQRHILFFEQMTSDPQRVLGALCSRIGLEEHVVEFSRVNAGGVPRSRWLYKRLSARSTTSLRLKSWLPPAVVHGVRVVRERMLSAPETIDARTLSNLQDEFRPSVSELTDRGLPCLEHWPAYRRSDGR